MELESWTDSSKVKVQVSEKIYPLSYLFTSSLYMPKIFWKSIGTILYTPISNPREIKTVAFIFKWKKNIKTIFL